MAQEKSKLMSTEQFYAASLLKFGWLDNFDIIILLDEIKNNSEFSFSDNKRKTELDKYIDTNEVITSLKSNYTLDTKVASKVFGIITLRQKLRMMVSDEVEEYFQSIDLVYFVLRKIKYLTLASWKIDLEMFNPLEQKTIMELISKGYCLGEYSTDSELDINLSQLGELQLFLLKNALVVEQFKEEALSFGFDSSQVDNYLMGQNLDRNIDNILDIKRLKIYYQALKDTAGTTRS